jgi:tRNA pseudouridine38-40 synthase
MRRVRNLRLLLEYDGTDFCGWQKQPGVRTVQQAIESAVSVVLRHPTTVWGCARTDAGVHALGYVAHFHTEGDFPVERLAVSLNGVLPEDVVVRRADEAAPGFHARFDAVARRYQYRIATEPTAVWRRFACRSRHRLDPAAMAAGAEYLVGEHDFTGYTAAANDAHPVCRVLETSVSAEGSFLLITIEANRFLYHMVRVIAGTLMEVGRGRMGPEQVGVALRTKDRRAAGPTAPAHGLTLLSVRYG